MSHIETIGTHVPRIGCSVMFMFILYFECLPYGQMTSRNDSTAQCFFSVFVLFNSLKASYPDLEPEQPSQQRRRGGGMVRVRNTHIQCNFGLVYRTTEIMNARQALKNSNKN